MFSLGCLLVDLSLSKKENCPKYPFIVTRYHSLSLVLPLADTRCHSLYNSLSLDVSLVCFFINDHLFTSSHSQMIFQIGVVKNLQFYLKETSTEVFSCEICAIFENILLHRTSPMAAFVFSETKG